uniref:ADAM metallopeptidase with thrombospondin type 1 motif 7 n=1 Tax=Varanus komodoensis TaxID=61221 RepID=A0A8D2LSQ7_VARKO
MGSPARPGPPLWRSRVHRPGLPARGRSRVEEARPSRGPAGSAGTAGPAKSGYDIVYPVKVDERGAFLSYNLSHRLLSKRALFAQNRPLAFYRLDHRGQQLRFNLSLNRHLLAPGFVSERRYGGIAHAKIRASHQNSCHMIGSVQNQEQDMGLAALSTCDGLRGVFRLANEDFFIEPLPPSSLRGEREAHSHRVYRRHQGVRRAEAPLLSPLLCQGSLMHSEKQREKWEERQQKRRRLRQRSVSKEKWVETLVVADAKMVQHHGSEHVEKYVLTVMNMVAGLFHDASIGNPIHISIVRLISLEEEEKDLKITHHADNTLRSFCKWQKAINIKGDAHPLHHDVAVLLTRKDLCTAMNHPCETLGLSHVSGMCQPHRSCNINEDTGLPLAFTVAHELGHSFGIQHDGSGNDCEPVGKRPFIMSPQLLYDTSPLTWSHCSREYITRFLDRGWGLCLDDPPAKDMIDFLSVPPGVLYDVGHQCRLQYGPYSTYCDDMDNVCSTLWCSVGNTCHSKLDAAVDGTRCDDDKWCFDGECVRVGHRPEPVDGGWAAWSSWAGCSRTCGGGVQNAERQCSSPTPKYGGKFCLGERKRFRVCSTQPCPAGKPSFRHVQCSYFDARPYKGKLYKWTPVPNKSDPCELHCRPENGYFAEKLRDAVADGTPCYEGSARRDLCINGICKNVGCDYEIDSYAVEDRCGMCRGDGSTCQTVKRTFEEREGRGYVDVGLIPAGAREIQIEEVAEAENFLALRSEDPEKYFLNGGWTIQWNGDYQVAGTTFTYKRTGNWENLTSPGPTEEPVWIQLLFQEKNPGIRYQYTIQREADSENEIAPAEFFWQYGSWTACTASCGTGVQRQTVRCTEKVAGVVEDRYCGALSRPDDKQRSCGEEPCPARWWTGEWQACSATCGDTGLMRRTILCIQSVAPDEQQALPPSECQHLPRPDATAPCNRERLCPAQWATGNWTQVRATPLPDWSGSGSSSRELFNEIHFLPNRHVPKPSSSQPSATGLNVLLEDNFPSSSSRQGNVFVDDFYYDYNFINFHEDLSLDPAGEMDGRKEGSDPDAEEQTPEGTTKGPEETHPGLLLTARPEDGVEGTNAWLNPVGMELAGTSRPAGHSAPPPARSTKATLDSPILGSNQSKVENTQNPPRASTRGTLSPPADPLPEGPSPSDPHSPGAWGQQAPTKLEPTLPSPSPSTLAAPREKEASERKRSPETKPALSPKAHGPFQGTEESLPNGIHWIFAPGSPGWGPGLTTAVPQEAGKSEAPPVVPPAVGLAAANASWESGNWSECSATCGLGAIWRTVRCSSGVEAECDPAGKPSPARRCYLGPCAAWRAGAWSKCSKACGGGVKLRDVHCADSRDQRPLRPFHCQAVPYKPPTQAPCHTEPCLRWYTSPWRECSEPCGAGEQERLVTCPEVGRCDEAARPDSTRVCNTHPCTKWTVGSWGQCTATCGGGIQRRQVKCVNTRTGEAEEDSGQCGHELWPESSRPGDCPLPPSGFVCERNRLSFGFCQTLLLLGRCHLPTVRIQCCQTCHQHGPGHPERGNQRASRK